MIIFEQQANYEWITPAQTNAPYHNKKYDPSANEISATRQLHILHLALNVFDYDLLILIGQSPVIKNLSYYCMKPNDHSSNKLSFNTTTETRKEDQEIHPRDLSGDQNESQSILASYANDTKANFFLTATIIIKTTIGSGIISLPYTISSLGYVFAIILFVIFFSLNQFASVLLLKSKNLSKHSNYSTILHYIWPSDASRIFGSAIIFIDNLGTCILQFILIKASVRKIASEVYGSQSILDQFYLTQYFIVILVGILQFPLVLIKKMERLRYISFFGVASIIVFIVAVISIYITSKIDGVVMYEMVAFPTNWFKAASAAVNIVFAFDYQMNFFPIYKGMKNVTDKRFEKACLVGIIGCAVPYLTVGMLGYSLVGNSKANFLQSLSYDNTIRFLFYLTYISYLISLLCAIVFMFFSCRNNFINIVNIIRKRWKAKQSDKLFIQSQVDQSKQIQYLSKGTRIRKANKEYYIYTAFLYILIIIGSIFLQNIELIFNFLAAACEAMLSILLPCTFYFMLIRRQRQKKRFIYYLAMVIVGIMTPYAIFSIVASYLPESN